MTQEELVGAFVEQLNSFQKAGKIVRYVRRESGNGYIDIHVLIPNGKNIKVTLGPEVCLLTFNDFYQEDAHITYDDADRSDVLKDLEDTVSRFLSNSYYEKVYKRNGKTLDRELYFIDENSNALGPPIRGDVSFLAKALKKFPGTSITTIRASEDGNSL